jgi:hypothetical protein
MMQLRPTRCEPEDGDSIFFWNAASICKMMWCHNPEDHILNLTTYHRLCCDLRIIFDYPSTDFTNCVLVILGCVIPVLLYTTTDYRNFLTVFHKLLIWHVSTCCICSSSGLFA